MPHIFIFFMSSYKIASQHPWHDGGRKRYKTTSRNSRPVVGGEEISAGSGTRRCGDNEKVRLLFRFLWLFYVKRFSFQSHRILLKAEAEQNININCVDPLGRSALLMAIDNENLEMVELLINHRVDTKDALLHAISEEFVEAVEVLLDHEDTCHKLGDPHVRLSVQITKYR